MGCMHGEMFPCGNASTTRCPQSCAGTFPAPPGQRPGALERRAEGPSVHWATKSRSGGAAPARTTPARTEADSAKLLLSSGYARYAEMQSLEVWGGTRHQGRAWVQVRVRCRRNSGGVGGGLFCYLLLCEGLGYRALYASIIGAAGGLSMGLVGAVIGSAVKSDIWTPVLIPGGLSLRWTVGGRPPH